MRPSVLIRLEGGTGSDIERGLTRALENGDLDSQHKYLSDLAMIKESSGDLEGALACRMDIVSVSKQLHSPLKICQAYAHVGRLLAECGKYKQSLFYNRQCHLQLAATSQLPEEEQQAWCNIGYTLLKRSESVMAESRDSLRALAAFRKSLEILKTLEETSMRHQLEADLLMNIGSALDTMGRHQESLTYLNQALDQLDRISNATDLSKSNLNECRCRIFSNLAKAHGQLYHHDLSIRFAQKDYYLSSKQEENEVATLTACRILLERLVKAGHLKEAEKYLEIENDLYKQIYLGKDSDMAREAKEHYEADVASIDKLQQDLGQAKWIKDRLLSGDLSIQEKFEKCLELGDLYASLDAHQKRVQVLEQAIKLLDHLPNMPENDELENLYANHALALMDLQQYEQALTSLDLAKYYASQSPLEEAKEDVAENLGLFLECYQHLNRSLDEMWTVCQEALLLVHEMDPLPDICRTIAYRMDTIYGLAHVTDIPELLKQVLTKIHNDLQTNNEEDVEAVVDASVSYLHTLKKRKSIATTNAPKPNPFFNTSSRMIPKGTKPMIPASVSVPKRRSKTIVIESDSDASETSVSDDDFVVDDDVIDYEDDYEEEKENKRKKRVRNDSSEREQRKSKSQSHRLPTSRRLAPSPERRRQLQRIMPGYDKDFVEEDDADDLLNLPIDELDSTFEVNRNAFRPFSHSTGSLQIFSNSCFQFNGQISLFLFNHAVRAMQSLQQANVQQVTDISFAMCHLTSQALLLLAQILPRFNQLTTLDLTCCAAITDESMIKVLEALIQSHPPLRLLNLSANALSSRILTTLSEIIPWKHLQYLDLSGNQLKSVPHEWVRVCRSESMSLLDLSENPWDDLNTFLEAFSTIHTLKLERMTTQFNLKVGSYHTLYLTDTPQSPFSLGEQVLSEVKCLYLKRCLNSMTPSVFMIGI